MKEVRPLTHALLAILAVALVSSVGAGVALHAMNGSSPNVITIEGKVVAVEWNPHWNAPTEIKVNANNTNYSVSLAPPWWWAEKKYPAIHVNDTVKITGVTEDDHEGNETADNHEANESADDQPASHDLNETMQDYIVVGALDANETSHEAVEITAYTISINGGAVITLRTGGMPAWAQERSGQTPRGESENETERDD